MRRDICYYFDTDVQSLYSAYLTAAKNAPFERSCSEEPFHTFSFGLNFSMKYNMNGGSCTLHFIPYQNGSAVDLRFSIAQLYGARYEAYASDLTFKASEILGKAAQMAKIDIEVFTNDANKVKASAIPAAPVVPVAPAAPVAPVVEGAKFCSNCGKKIEAGSAFCSGCGARLNAAPAPVVEAPVVETPVAPEAPVVEESIIEEIKPEPIEIKEEVKVEEEAPVIEAAPVIEEVAEPIVEAPVAPVAEAPVAPAPVQVAYQPVTPAPILEKRKFPLLPVIFMGVAFFFNLIINGMDFGSYYSVLSFLGYSAVLAGMIINKKNLTFICGIGFGMTVLSSFINLIENLSGYAGFFTVFTFFDFIIAILLALAFLIPKAGLSKVFKTIGAISLIALEFLFIICYSGIFGEYITNTVLSLLFVVVPKAISILMYNPYSE